MSRKPTNIFLKDGVVKLGDFGIAKKITEEDYKKEAKRMSAISRAGDQNPMMTLGVGTPLYITLQF